MIIHRHIFIFFEPNNNIKVIIGKANPKRLGISIENKYNSISFSSLERLELLLNKHKGYISLHNRRLFWDIPKIT